MMTATEDMRGSFATSFIVHGLIFAALIIGLPHLRPPPLELSQPIAIDIVDVGPVTTTQVQGTGQIAKQNNNAPAPLPPPPKQSAPEPAKPAPIKEQPKVDERKALDDLIGNEVKKADKTPPKPAAKPAQADPQQFDSLLKNLSKAPDQTQQTDAPPVKTAGPAAGSPGIQSDKLTISETDALRRQIEQCWNVPTGARDAGDLIVEIHVVVNADRTVQSADIVNTDKMSDPFFRAAAESAQRAILNPKCSPLNLPPDRATDWHDMTLRFNPKDVL